MLTDWNFLYSNLLHDAAARWGLPAIPGRPVIGLPPYYEGRGMGVVGNPYAQEPIPTAETHRYEKDRVRCLVRLFTFNGRWGFSLVYTGARQGFGYGNFLKFCQPHPARVDALAAAAAELAQRRDIAPEVLRWAEALSVPQQLALF
jgi:hypothetical protein